jgi:hypothetical protein
MPSTALTEQSRRQGRSMTTLLQQCGVPDSEPSSQRVLGVPEKAIIEPGARADEMRRQRRLGRAYRPDMQIVYLSYPGQRAQAVLHFCAVDSRGHGAQRHLEGLPQQAPRAPPSLRMPLRGARPSWGNRLARYRSRRRHLYRRQAKGLLRWFLMLFPKQHQAEIADTLDAAGGALRACWSP